MELFNNPHRRFNPLTGDWVLVSPHRTQRPWQGQQERQLQDNRPEHDSGCYLCPGNKRAGGHQNPHYKDTFVFTNDFAALLPETKVSSNKQDDLFQAESVKGTSRVICFSPRHDLTLAEMPPNEIKKVIDIWTEQTAELGKIYRWVQIFENRGEVMGSSNPHPHGQIWAGNALPNEPYKENQKQWNYFSKNHSPLLVDYLTKELKGRGRLIVENEHWVVLTPFWAVWPFETILLPKRHVLRLTNLTEPEQISLAGILKSVLTRYDNLFQASFPYTMGWHGAPFDADDMSYWQLHAHFYPPLLRSATIKKFMVGYEMLAEAQRDITAEQAAERLRSLPETHYKSGIERVK